MSSRLTEAPILSTVAHINTITPQPGGSQEIYDIVKGTDVEGPQSLGDDACLLVNGRVKPEKAINDISYGTIFYTVQHDAYAEYAAKHRIGQIGSDVVLPLAPLLYNEVTDKEVADNAILTSGRTPGAPEYVSFLRSLGHTRIVAITTAWAEPHRKLVLEDYGLDELIATEFSLDKAKQHLVDSGRLNQEMRMTGQWLKECFRLIQHRETTKNPDMWQQYNNELKATIMDFFVNKIGISWDEAGNMIPANHVFTTELGRIMAQFHVIGDIEKARAVMELSQRFTLAPDAPEVIYIGDGVNDGEALKVAPWSIALYGREAAKSAKIGVITHDVRNLKPLIEAIRRHRISTEENVEQVIFEANEANTDPNTIFHAGGPHTPKLYLDLHDQAKIFVRGAVSAAVDNAPTPLR